MHAAMQSFRSLASLVLDHPAEFSSRRVLEHNSDSLTYTELRECVMACAANLERNGVAPGDHVILTIENSLDYIVCLFATLTLGATAVPLNPETTVEAANFALRYCPQARRFYDRKKSQTNRVLAIKALAHKLARACYHMLRDQKPFDVSRCFA